jgi:hypothetical protein
MGRPLIPKNSYPIEDDSMKAKYIFGIASVIALVVAIPFLQKQLTSPSGASQPYKSRYVQDKNAFTDYKCLAAKDQSKIQAEILKETKKVSPKGVSYRDVIVAVTHKYADGNLYTLQIVDYRKGGCSLFYSTITGDEDEIIPLSRYQNPDVALQNWRLWENWKLKNIPKYREQTQKYLSGKTVRLAKEQYLVYKQLGFNLPPKWEEVK